MSMEIKILSIDPSSTITGYALMDISDNLLAAGLIRPNKSTDPPLFRIHTMCGDLEQLIKDTKPDVIVIESTEGKVGRKRHKGSGAGLAVYGMAVGAMWYAALKSQCKVEAIGANEWTRGKKKEERIAEMAGLYPEYNAKTDTGGDIGDAICMGRFYIRKRKIQLLTTKYQK